MDCIIDNRRKLTSETCSKCGKEHLSFDELGLCRKLIDENIDKFLCLDCLAEMFRCNRAILEMKIRQFKSENCRFFRNEVY